jgi:nitrile hydratase accessory protein
MSSRRPRVPERLPSDTGDQVFQAPWEARAFAMAVDMSRRGLFEWDEFRELLIDEIARGDAGPQPESGSSETYYLHWLAALERLLRAKGHVSSELLADRKRAIEEHIEAERAAHRHP